MFNFIGLHRVHIGMGNTFKKIKDTKTKATVKDVKEADKLLSKGEVINKKELEGKPVIASEFLKKPDVDYITKEQINKVYPRKLNEAELESSVELFNIAMEQMNTYGMESFFKEVSLGYTQVLKGNKTNTQQEYINAAKFITFRNSKDNLITAYAKTFPDRIKRMEEEGTCSSYLATYAHAYSKTTLVAKLQAATLVPAHILYQDVFSQAVETQAKIMVDVSISPKVRSDAANSLMTHLKTPEIKQMELAVNVDAGQGLLDQFKESMAAMAANQKQMLEEKTVTLDGVAKQVIFEEKDHDE